LTKKINRLLKSGQFYNLSLVAQKKLIAKFQLLHKNLKWILPKKQLQKIVAGAAMLLSVSLGNVHAQFLSPVENPFGLTGGANYKLPTLADIDGDGDMDLLTVSYEGYSGNLEFYENTGTASLPAFSTTPEINPFGFTINAAQNETIWNMDLTDMDSDGDMDMLLGAYVDNGATYDGTFFYYENTGTAQAPSFASPVMNPFGIGTTNKIALLNLVDLDGDGDFDVFATEYYGAGFYFENTGTASTPIFSNGVEAPFNLTAFSGSNSISFVEFGDLDGDGDMDVLTSDFRYDDTSETYEFPFFYQENTGNPTGPTFAAPDFVNNPIAFDNLNDSLLAFISITDLDNDGDMDVLMNAATYDSNTELFSNNWLYFENAETVKTEELFTDSNVQFYPNPTTGQVTIKSDSDLLLTDLKIYDITGRMVEQIKLTSSSIDVSHLSNGVYILKVYNENEFLGGNKLIKK